MELDFNGFKWINKPEKYHIGEDAISIITLAETDFWQNTYYGFVHDNAHAFLTEIEDEYFSFSVKTSFDSKRRFDQCGILVYTDSQNWVKASVEYENEEFQRLGSVVTNNGFSDWATTDIPSNIKEVWYRLSRRKADLLIESSFNGVDFKQMRICHMFSVPQKIRFGIYACSPEKSSFEAVFSDFKLTECLWLEHK